jgi:5'-AMP-activated protein kinase regulatory gamma subunit
VNVYFNCQIHEIPRPTFLNKKLREVRIGSFDEIETAREDTPIIVALQKFLDRRISALPIVDEQNRLLDIYARFDVINLAAEKTYNNLDITLKQVRLLPSSIPSNEF